MLAEFSSTANMGPIDTTDPESMAEDGQIWEALEKEETTQGFIDDIQGLLNGK